jgi:hypothetical protein
VTLPFDVAQFFAVFARYNAAVWPTQIVLTALAVAAILLALRSRGWSDRAVGAVLGFFWIWMGAVYHWGFFRAINPAAALFGGLFVLEGIALAALGGGCLRYPSRGPHSACRRRCSWAYPRTWGCWRPVS